jgi:hypothetical protein
MDEHCGKGLPFDYGGRYFCNAVQNGFLNESCYISAIDGECCHRNSVMLAAAGSQD